MEKLIHTNENPWQYLATDDPLVRGTVAHRYWINREIAQEKRWQLLHPPLPSCEDNREFYMIAFWINTGTRRYYASHDAQTVARYAKAVAITLANILKYDILRS